MFTDKEKELYRAMDAELSKYNAESWKVKDRRAFLDKKEREIADAFGSKLTLTEMRLAANSRVNPRVDNVRD